MNRTRTLALVGLLGVGGIAAASTAISKSPEPPRAPVSAAPERAANDGRLDREVQALAREVAELRAARRPQELPSAPPSAGTPVPSLRRGPPNAEDLERIRTENEAEIAALASRMDTEPRDPSWSRAAEQRLSEAFRSQATPGIELVSVDCHTAICGATFRHDDAEGQKAIPHLIGATLPYSAEMVYEYSTDGASTTVYISREGKHLAER